MSTVMKEDFNHESYSPGEKPEIVSFVEKIAENKPYQVYKDIELYMDMVELPESLKMAGITSENHPNFANIEKYHDDFKSLMLDRYSPYTEIGASGNLFSSNGIYFFGCQVESLEELPDGLSGFDFGIKKFATITFRASSAYDLVGGADGPGDGMKTAGEYIKEVWLPHNMEKVYPVNLDHMYFEIKEADKDYCLFLLEVYKVELSDEPEMCYYIPLKD